ncbi:YcjF family protein [Alteromonas lipolytica]|uniref:DUF697 domain-containing protein n=1 Tax=Alteromonas lipolytica TaxID=1856405 RepID=A0A1E8FIS6_9ALTE|nr:YcjF family protein [Alteromonas lipolytica]OFI35508.1 hypothetical protein BFC17_12140 [Alteromonas lipolytica]GGF76825.1 hypothetical protein GCM10011338_31310 [Alteromonas lipolytica]
MSTTEKPYRSKVTQMEIDAQPPDHAMPAKREAELVIVDDPASGLSAKWLALLSGIGCVLGFSLFEALNFIEMNFAASPISTSLLAVLLGVFVVSLGSLTLGEVRGYRKVSQFIHRRPKLAELASNDSTQAALDALKLHASQFSRHSYAEQCYKRFTGLVKADHTSAEIVEMYRQFVAEPVKTKASEVVKKESMASGSMAFISPNHLIQSLMILWISMRTIKRVAKVYGLRPATAGNWKLMKILAQNLAAQSIFDLATDEMTNQLSGSLAAKLMENSAEAVAAGALNIRLGKTLMRLLEEEK